MSSNKCLFFSHFLRDTLVVNLEGLSLLVSSKQHFARPRNFQTGRTVLEGVISLQQWLLPGLLITSNNSLTKVAFDLKIASQLALSHHNL
ncbi:hypothetical protein NC651_030626 [Populus alba x Populus x berolinensis]|nr:hypothetical protein NC651_030626 [Populus alba x Populus x berolinensis]